MGRIVVGTSSWTDPGFVDEWYPADLTGRARELASRAGQVRLMFDDNRGSDAPVAAERARELLSVGSRG